MPEAASAANQRQQLNADRIPARARAEAYRQEFLTPDEEGDDVERMGIEEFEQQQGESYDDQRVAADRDDLSHQRQFEEQRVHGRTAAPRRPMVRPPGYAQPPAARPAPGTQPILALARIEPEHVDRLWDWIREDGDLGATFLGSEFTTSVRLHAFMRGLVDAEAQGLAVARAITYGDQHLGFLMLSPILTVERMAILHCYLSPGTVRERGGEMLPFFVEIGTRMVPGFKLAIPSPSAEWAEFHQKVLGPLGFAPHTMFVR